MGGTHRRRRQHPRRGRLVRLPRHPGRRPGDRRGDRGRAARANAAPAQQAANLAVLEATVKRVDEENGQLRGKMSRLESVVRAFAWTTDRWAQQMHRAGIEPEPAHPLVDEYNRTGV
ncbi:hypothetical protein [Streptomyces ipomoeae]|uniref:hypothetical protein n=1 Tax=Streptomyces ipomoeae TaxID=103232 RepID=UPI00215C34F0|nr:hypothetical protein [Streptomyces ipomoeae]